MNWFLLTLACSAFAIIAAFGLDMVFKNPRDRQWVWRLALLLSMAPSLALSLEALGVQPVALQSWPAIPPVGDHFLGGSEMNGTAVSSGTIQTDWVFFALSSLIAAVWLSRAIAAVRAEVALRRHLNALVIVEDDAPPTSLARIARHTGLKRTPHVRYLRCGRTAFAMGWKRGTLCLPLPLLDRLSSDQLDQVLLHECTHLRRGDLIWRRVERLLCDVLAFSPFSWIARWRLEDLRELGCDSAAVLLSQSPRLYAETLLLAASCQQAPYPTTAFNPKGPSPMKRRIQSIAEPKIRKPARLAGLTVMAVAMFPFAVAQMVPGDVAEASYTHPVLLDGYKMTSGFGMRPDPFTDQQRYHRGVDISGKEGTAIFAPASGEVLFAGQKAGYGNMVDVAVSGDTVLRFAQLNSVSVEEGERVSAGQSIATLGSSGRSTGPHLHFEVIVEGVPVDPATETGLEVLRK